MAKIDPIDRAAVRALAFVSSDWSHGEHPLVVEMSDIDDLPTLDVQPVDAVFTLRQALAHMWFACVNKDGEHPHEFELEAVREAEVLLGKWEDCMPIMMGRADDETD